MLNLLSPVYFGSSHRHARDASEVRSLYVKYGDEALDILERRAQNRKLAPRDRRHWKRLANKARAMSSMGTPLQLTA